MLMPANVLGEIMMLFVKERECVFAHVVQWGAERGAAAVPLTVLTEAQCVYMSM